MRLRLLLCILLPLFILSLGAGVLGYTRSVSLALQQPLAQAEALVVRGQYAEASALVKTLDALWEEKGGFLQLFVDHNAIDDVSLELIALRAGIDSHSAPAALLALGRLREHAQHLLHRDLPVPANIL
jgi:hypothetical protein